MKKMVLNKNFPLGQLGTTEEYEYQLVKILLNSGECPTRCHACHREIQQQCNLFNAKHRTLSLTAKGILRYSLAQKLIDELPEGRFEQILFEINL